MTSPPPVNPANVTPAESAPDGAAVVAAMKLAIAALAHTIELIERDGAAAGPFLDLAGRIVQPKQPAPAKDPAGRQKLFKCHAVAYGQFLDAAQHHPGPNQDGAIYALAKTRSRHLAQLYSRHNFTHHQRRGIHIRCHWSGVKLSYQKCAQSNSPESVHAPIPQT